MKLINYKNKSIKRGTVFRLPAVWPYEEWVDFMVIDLFETHGLVVSSGHKAGLILISLPIESASVEGRALSTEWIITNWAKWIYPECNIEDVHILDKYVATPIT
ncbi:MULTISPECIES: Imm45 family immunity protein [Pantoea]|uniref:Imm45 family immunity protein n=1 Tax=Pantoea TaxID=53335 RepID=UPI0022F1A89A|nr:MULTISPECIES: Imm45 family immunity protein [Pantoea]WBV22405.1 Imm45 family immunity protein [Pantoea piersonii]